MRTRSILMAGLLLAMTAAPAWADAAPEPQEAAVVTVGASDETGEAAIAVGQHLIVKLLVAGGTGFSWKYNGVAAPELALIEQRSERSAARLGAPQLTVFEFEGAAAGDKALMFDFIGPGATTPAKTYVLSVTVQ